MNIDTVFRRVNEDLVAKGKGQYKKNATFNRDITAMQEVLMNYHIKNLTSTGNLSESLSPFLKQEVLTIVGGYTDKPEDFRHVVDARYWQVLNAASGEPTVKKIYLNETTWNEAFQTSLSPIRRTNKNKNHVNYTIIGSRFFFDDITTGRLELKYIMKPPLAERDVDLNVITDNEDYDADDSIDLLWLDQDFENVVNIMLLFKGVEIKDADIVAYAKAYKVEERIRN